MQQQNKFENVFALDSVTINVTNRCNLSCTYCFEHDKDASMMEEKTMIDILDKAYASRNKEEDIGKFMVNIFGGEPMLNWEVIKAGILHADKNRYDMRFGITTNLTILTDEMIDIIDEYGVVLLVSFDGLKKYHDAARCNSHDIVRENLQKILDRNLQPITEIRMTITPENVCGYYKGIKYVFDMGFDSLVPCIQSDTSWDIVSLLILIEESKKIMKFYLSVIDDVDSKRNLSIKMFDDYIFTNLEPFAFDSRQCAIGTPRWCSIGVNGEVMQCHQWHTIEEFKCKSFGTIYDSFKKEDIFKEPPKFKITDKCNDCLAMSVCKGGCPTQNFTNCGSFDKPTDAYCNTCSSIAGVIKLYQLEFMNMKNPRSRKMAVLKENLKIKEYFDNVVCTTPINSSDFPIVMSEFQSMMDKNKEIIPSSFGMYYILKLYPTAHLVGGMTNGE